MQRGFAGAVGADQADAVAGRDQPVRVFEEEFVAEAFSGAGKLNHGLELSSHKAGAAGEWERENEVAGFECNGDLSPTIRLSTNVASNKSEANAALA